MSLQLKKVTINYTPNILTVLFVGGVCRRTIPIAAVVLLTFIVNPIWAGTSWDGENTRVSIASDGTQGNEDSSRYRQPSLSADGRYIAFYSEASNLVPVDTNGYDDIFVYDRETSTIKMVSVATNGTQGNGDSTNQTISADGRYVVFSSFADNLVGGETLNVDLFIHDMHTGVTEALGLATGLTHPWIVSVSPLENPSISADTRYVAFVSGSPLLSGDTDSYDDVYIYDRETGQKTLVKSTGGVQPPGATNKPSISADGRFVAFHSESKMAVEDTNDCADVYVYDRQNGITELISMASDGTPGNDNSDEPSISADGRYIAFMSWADNLVPGDTESGFDIYVHDRQTHSTEQISLAADGARPDNNSDDPVISADGRYVVFHSVADNLVSGDLTNADVFLRDRQTARTYWVSRGVNASQSNSWSDIPTISADGNYVAFVSNASNIIAGDLNNSTDVFVSTVAFRTTDSDILNFLPAIISATKKQ